MGVHTGDSMTVAPAMTLTDREYQVMRNLGLEILRAVGVATGGCNIQFAIEPATGRMIVIEMNPRVSRSSALASKATGFPIAKIAAKLAIGYTLDEIANDITKATPAAFEPILDYVVVKVPRFAFEKFPGADPTLTTTMKSVGEAMSIGRSFAEALGKAMRSMETKALGFFDLTSRRRRWTSWWPGRPCPPTAGCTRSSRRCWPGPRVERSDDATGIDPWFLEQLGCRIGGRRGPRRRRIDRALLRRAKRYGLSDLQIARLRPELGGRLGGPDWAASEAAVREKRWTLGVRPVFKTVDTCAAEFEAQTPYHYSAYETDPAAESEVLPQTTKPEGDHPGLRAQPDRAGHRIRLLLRARRAGIAGGRFRDRHGQLQPGDRVHRLRHLRPAVLRAADRRGRAGSHCLRTGVRHGGRGHRHPGRPDAAEASLPPGRCVGRRRGTDRGRRLPVAVLGTSSDAIDLAEDRGRFGDLLRSAGLPAPAFGMATSFDQAREVADRIGYPVLVRPSYVLGGRGMQIVYDEPSLADYISRGDGDHRRTSRCWSTGSWTTPSRSTSMRSATAPRSTSAA